jgi:hypothetical protein
LASGVSLLISRIAPAELRQSYGFDYDGLDSESPNTSTPPSPPFPYLRLAGLLPPAAEEGAPWTSEEGRSGRAPRPLLLWADPSTCWWPPYPSAASLCASPPSLLLSSPSLTADVRLQIRPLPPSSLATRGGWPLELVVRWRAASSSTVMTAGEHDEASQACERGRGRCWRGCPQSFSGGGGGSEVQGPVELLLCLFLAPGPPP